jgi:predicted membrane-bound mannosyltransferase
MAMPLLLLRLNLGELTLVIFMIAASSLITDELLTRIALKLGCKEMNLFFNLLKRKMGEEYVHTLITCMGALLLFFLVVLFYGNVLLLLIFAVGFNVPVVTNALTLYGKVRSYKTCDSNEK